MNTLNIEHYTDMNFGIKDFRLSLQCIWELRQSGSWRSVKWEIVTVILGQIISSIFKCQAALENC
jgi:hypothetical protein